MYGHIIVKHFDNNFLIRSNYKQCVSCVPYRAVIGQKDHGTQCVTVATALLILEQSRFVCDKRGKNKKYSCYDLKSAVYQKLPECAMGPF